MSEKRLLFFLQEIICKDPGDIDFGNKQLYRRNFEEDYLEVGDRVEYNCFPGYEMEGSKYLVCGSTGEWNKDKPKCKRKLSRQFFCVCCCFERDQGGTLFFEGCNYSFGTQFPPTLLQPNLEKKIIPTVMGISTVMVYHHSIV